MLEHLPSIDRDQFLVFLEENLTVISSQQTGLLRQLEDHSPAIYEAVKVQTKFIQRGGNLEKDIITSFLLILELVSEGVHSMQIGEALDLLYEPDRSIPS